MQINPLVLRKAFLRVLGGAGRCFKECGAKVLWNLAGGQAPGLRDKNIEILQSIMDLEKE